MHLTQSTFISNKKVENNTVENNKVENSKVENNKVENNLKIMMMKYKRIGFRARHNEHRT